MRAGRECTNESESVKTLSGSKEGGVGERIISEWTQRGQSVKQKEKKKERRRDRREEGWLKAKTNGRLGT